MSYGCAQGAAGGEAEHRPLSPLMRTACKAEDLSALQTVSEIIIQMEEGPRALVKVKVTGVLTWP